MFKRAGVWARSGVRQARTHVIKIRSVIVFMDNPGDQEVSPFHKFSRVGAAEADVHYMLQISFINDLPLSIVIQPA
jgi:hypothetical protein